MREQEVVRFYVFNSGVKYFFVFKGQLHSTKNNSVVVIQKD